MPAFCRGMPWKPALRSFQWHTAQTALPVAGHRLDSVSIYGCPCAAAIPQLPVVKVLIPDRNSSVVSTCIVRKIEVWRCVRAMFESGKRICGWRIRILLLAWVTRSQVRLSEVLDGEGFDPFVEKLCSKFYADKVGRPRLSPGIYFHPLMISYFEG